MHSSTMAEKTDWAKLSKNELLEMLRRQEKLLANKKFLQSLPDKGKKVTETVEKLKELLAKKKQIEDTMAQFERMTVSQLVQRTQHDILDSDDSDDNISYTEYEDGISPAKDKVDSSIKSTKLHKETYNNPKKAADGGKTNGKRSSLTSTRNWNYESSATPPQYKLEKTKPLSLDESFQLLQDQEKKQKELQAQHATLKIREQGFLGVTDSQRYCQVVQNPLQYRETTVQDEYLSDDSQQEEKDMRQTEMDSDDQENTEH